MTRLVRCNFLAVIAVFLSSVTVSSAVDYLVPEIPPSFLAHVVVKNLNAKPVEVFEATELYDHKQHKGALRLHTPPKGNTQIIFDNKAKKQLIIKDSALCETIDYGKISSKGPGLNVAESLGLFKNVQPSEYEQLHGIKAVILKTSVDKVMFNFTGSINAYWSEYGQLLPYCGTNDDCSHWSMPLQIDVDGFVPNKKVHNVYEFTEYYDFANPDMFTISDGVYCQNYSQDNSKKFPSLHQFHSMKIELYSVDSDKNINKRERKVWYSNEKDGLTSIVRVDERVISDDPKKFTDFSKQIYDLKKEVLYNINADTGKCKIIDVNLNSNVSLNGETLINQLILQLGEPDQFSFIGQRKCRYGTCDVWAAKPENYIINVYFNQTTTYINSDGNSLDVQSPLMILRHYLTEDKTPELKQLDAQYIFDYRPAVPNWELFDTSDCFEESQKLRFTITMTGSYFGGIQNNLERFKTNFINAIQVYVEISKLRLTDVQITNIGNDFILGTVTLLEDPYNLGKIGKEPSLKPLTNRAIYDTLAKNIDDRTFKVLFSTDINSADRKSTIICQGKEITEVLSEEKTMEKSELLSQFVEIPEKDVTLKDSVVFGGMSVDECAEACGNERSFHCEAFTYCATGKCQLLFTHSTQLASKYIQTASRCSIYNRNFTFDYKMYPGDSLLMQSGDKIESNLDLEECSRRCSSQNKKVTSGECRSYDICGAATSQPKAKKYCVFHSRNIQEVTHSEIKTNPYCIHMSKKDLIDFQMLPNKAYSGEDYYRYETQLSADGCAAQCYLDPNGCTAIEMCGDKKGDKFLCVLLRPKIKDQMKPIALNDSSSCDFYKRNDLAMNWRYGNEPQNQPQKQEEYSKGSFAALSICMLIIGITLGLVGTYYVVMYNVKRNPNNILVVRMLATKRTDE